MDSPADPDRQDGQSNCNLTRVSMARALVEWLAKNPTKDPTPDDDRRVLILGDFNAFQMEDPIRASTDPTFTAGVSQVFPTGLKASNAAHYRNLGPALLGSLGYSQSTDGVFGERDHALATPWLFRAVTGVARWQINADEPVALDYNTDFSSNGLSGTPKSAAQQSALFAPDPFRMSGHDPIIIGFNPLCGDVNDDGVVDHDDQRLIQDATKDKTVNRRYDLDVDGRVTNSDLQVFRACRDHVKKDK
jgi:predicted extracellular nuclease